MALNVYKRSAKPENCIDFNDQFFDVYTSLGDGLVSSPIIKAIDGSVYVDRDLFVGKYTKGPISRVMLSSGCKTVLNVAAHPDKCFDAIECGDNALAALLTINTGNVVWPNRLIYCEPNLKCSVKCDGILFTRASDFMAYLNYGKDDYLERVED